MKKSLLTISAAVCLVCPTLFAIEGAAIGAAAGKKEITTKAVMKEQMKGDTSPIKKAGKGELDAAGIQSLLDGCKAIVNNKPPKGDETKWKEKTEALVKAIESLQKGEADAAKKVQAAANCKACHDEHKGK